MTTAGPAGILIARRPRRLDRRRAHRDTLRVRWQRCACPSACIGRQGTTQPPMSPWLGRLLVSASATCVVGSDRSSGRERDPVRQEQETMSTPTIAGQDRDPAKRVEAILRDLMDAAQSAEDEIFTIAEAARDTFLEESPEYR